ncbi:YcxB family protein [Jeotgalibaca porci]
MFLLVVNKYSYMPIPKSFFRTKEEIDTFKKILSHHVRNFRT